MVHLYSNSATNLIEVFYEYLKCRIFAELLPFNYYWAKKYLECNLFL